MLLAMTNYATYKSQQRMSWHFFFKTRSMSLLCLHRMATMPMKHGSGCGAVIQHEFSYTSYVKYNKPKLERRYLEIEMHEVRQNHSFNFIGYNHVFSLYIVIKQCS